MSLFRGRAVFIAAIFLFRALLDFSYAVFVSPLYEYAGFDLQVNAFKYVSSWFFLIISVFFTNLRLVKVSDYLFLLAVLGVIAPMTSLYGMSARGFFPILITLLSTGVVRFIVTSPYIKVPRLPIFVGGPILAVGLSVWMVALLAGWYFASGAVSYFNLDFTKVYDFRGLSAEKANIGVLAYLNSWVYQVFTIFLFAYSLFKRQFLLGITVLLFQVFFFGVSGHKSLFFYPFMVLGIWFYFRKTSSLAVVPIIFSVVISVSLLLWWLFSYVMPASMFVRRVFFVPAILTYDYFEFFSERDYIFWGNSILSRVIDYPYSVSVSSLIGDFNGSDASANNGYISSGYAHAGVAGVLIYSCLFGIVVRFVDVLSRDLPVWFGLTIVIVPYRSALISSDLLTVLLTHGLMVAIFLLIIVRQRNFSQEQR